MSISSTTTFKAAYLPNAPPTYVAMRGNMGIAPFPGSTRVLDRATGRMVPCDVTLCPLATSTSPDLVRACTRGLGTWSGSGRGSGMRNYSCCGFGCVFVASTSLVLAAHAFVIIMFLIFLLKHSPYTMHLMWQDGVSRPVNRPTPSNNVVVTINAQSPAKYQFYAYS